MGCGTETGWGRVVREQKLTWYLFRKFAGDEKTNTRALWMSNQG